MKEWIVSNWLDHVIDVIVDILISWIHSGFNGTSVNHAHAFTHTVQLHRDALRFSFYWLFLHWKHSLKSNVSLSGMHINCDNEGHPEEQLESYFVSSTLSVGKLLPSVCLTRTSENTICSPPTPSHLSLACYWEIQSETKAVEVVWDTVRSDVQIEFKWDRTLLTDTNLRSCFPFRIVATQFEVWITVTRYFIVRAVEEESENTSF